MSHDHFQNFFYYLVMGAGFGVGSSLWEFLCRCIRSGAKKVTILKSSATWQIRRLPVPALSAKAQVSESSCLRLVESFKNNIAKPSELLQGRLMRHDGSFLTTVSHRTGE